MFFHVLKYEGKKKRIFPLVVSYIFSETPRGWFKLVLVLVVCSLQGPRFKSNWVQTISRGHRAGGLFS